MGPQPGLPNKGLWMGLLGLGAFAALGGGFILVRKLMDTQLPKVQKVSAAACGAPLSVLCQGASALSERLCTSYCLLFLVQNSPFCVRVSASFASHVCVCLEAAQQLQGELGCLTGRTIKT